MRHSSRLLASCLLGVTFSLPIVEGAGAQQPQSVGSNDLPFEAQIQPCWSTIAGADTPAIITFKLKPDGSLDGTPEIKSQGKGAANDFFARSARRAIMKCSPYKVGDKLQIETTFIPDPTEAQPKSHEAPKFGVADLQDGDPRTRVVDFGAVKVGLSVPEGLCAIDPKRGGYQEKLWKAMSPPTARQSELKSLDIDCVSLRKAEAGGGNRPKYGFTVTRFSVGNKPITKNLAAFLDDVAKDAEPMSPRFWERPPMAGSVFLGRDDRAVYAAQRFLEDGKMVMSGVNAFTLVEGMPIMISHFAVEGPDLAAERQVTMTGIVDAMRVVAED